MSAFLFCAYHVAWLFFLFIDGQKLTDHTEYGTPLLIDPASIERIEILRESSSVVSGGRAIGGVVNIVTKKGADKPLEISTQAGYFSATKGYRTSTALSGSQSGFDYRLRVSRSELNDRATPKGRLKPSSTDDSSISAHLGYQAGKHYIAAKAQRLTMWLRRCIGSRMVLQLIYPSVS